MFIGLSIDLLEVALVCPKQKVAARPAVTVVQAPETCLTAREACLNCAVP